MPPSIPQIINHIWFYVLAMINAGRINNIVLPLTMKAIIGQHGIDLIISRFANTINAPVDAVEVIINGLIHIFPRSNPNGRISIFDAQGPKSEENTSPGKVSRPPNAFILYRAAHHPLIKAQNPTMHNNQISIILGAQWRNESNATKDKYRAEAEAIKKQHGKDHPNYSYQPRKSGDKKRRMTDKKAAVLADIAAQASTSAVATVASATPGTGPVVATSNLGIGGLNISPLGFDASDTFDDDFLADLPELETTEAGNPMFTLGDIDVSDEQLYAMVQEYNASIAAGTPADAWTAAIYYERSDEAQNQLNFFNSVVDYDGSLEVDQRTMQNMQASYAADVHEVDAQNDGDKLVWFDNKYEYFE